MHVTSLCPFCVSTLVWEAQPSQFSLTVTVKATFSLVHDGEARVADRQEPLSPDRHWDDRPMASLFAPGDLVPSKRRVDVLLVGHAYSIGQPTSSLVARFAVGDVLDKSVRVTGDRTWEPGEGAALRPSDIQPFPQLPLRYELAPLSADNPVGIDGQGPPVTGALARPNLEGLVPEGVPGFGPIATTWRARRTLVDDAGLFWAYGVASEAPAQPGPPPPGFDFAFFNAAPREQQLELVRPGMKIVLENMNPRHATLVTTVPAIRPQVFRVTGDGARAEEITLRCDTLWIDTDRELLVLTFRGVGDAGDGKEAGLGRLVVAADPAGKKLRWDRVQKLLETEVQTTSEAGAGRAANDDDAPARDPLSVRYDAVVDDATRGKVPDYQAAASSPKPPAPVAPEVIAPPRAAMPSEPPRPGPGKSARPPPRPGPRPPGDVKTTPPPPLAPAAVAPPPVTMAEPVAPPPLAPSPTASRPMPPSNPPPEPTQRISMPELHGAPAFDPDASAPTRHDLDVRALTPDDASRVLAGDLGQSTDDFDEPTRAKRVGKRQITSPGGQVTAIEPAEVGLFAAVSAHLARKGIERAAVLVAHGMSETDFTALAERWRLSLEAEDDQGKKDLASAFDMAYVAAQERLEPPIGIAEYAQIVVALERGDVGRVLGELDLELSDLMRLQRVWARRTAASPVVNTQLNAAIEAMRRD